MKLYYFQTEDGMQHTINLDYIYNEKKYRANPNKKGDLVRRAIATHQTWINDSLATQEERFNRRTRMIKSIHSIDVNTQERKLILTM